MKTDRRQFLKTTSLTLGAASLLPAFAAEPSGQPSFILRPSRMKLGIVTYNIAKDWDLATIIKNCSEARFQGVELRTGHAHHVEVNLNKEQRAEVKQRFHDAPVEL